MLYIGGQRNIRKGREIERGRGDRIILKDLLMEQQDLS